MTLWKAICPGILALMENEDAVLCSWEWIQFLESMPVFSNVYPPRKQTQYRILLADCAMNFRARDWDDILADWGEEDAER